ncbi:5-methyltetrahydropteroyltriglutamate--homocysteine S-methyltransferase [Intrasporangium sp.]|uniref:5-methyltetrahydropteroyltriglutamate-- homocysteine S-methyltransferase n=1 Tax=Intrasporangium sp. TaxID=1925024 RepID=UPI0032213B92
MSAINPPFRADHVGSLLRPPAIHEARARVAAGELDAAGLRAVEDAEIASAVRKLEATGMQSVTDGEFRRAFFHLDFLQQVEGVAVTGNIAASSDSATTVHMTPPKLSVRGPLRRVRDIQVDDYRYLASVTTRTPKVSIPSPTMVHFRGGRAGVDIDAYPDLGEFFADLAAVYRAEIDALYAAGCRYLQLDDTNLAYLCDPEMRAGAIERGDDPDALPHAYAELINATISGRPDDLTVAVHLCRGNYRSTYFASGGYEPVAEVLFNELDVDAYFLEYDDERSGDFAPLRHVPADRTVVLGVVTSKRPELESYETVAARFEDASRYLPMDQLCLSPQCGFASTVEGNRLTEDEQWAKLERVVQIAGRLWQ